MARYCLLFLALCALSWGAESAKILAVLPVPGYSHFMFCFRIVKELADRGHEVTVISPFPQKTPIKNYRDISIQETGNFFKEMRPNLFEMGQQNTFATITRLLDLGNKLTETVFSHKNVQELLNSGETFDVMLMEQFMNEAVVGIGHHFKVPIVLLSSTGSSILTNYIFANPAPASYVPNVLGTFSKHMDFCQRLQNFFFNWAYTLFRELIAFPSQRKIFKKYTKTDLEMDDVLYNISLMLTNSHVSVHDAVPHVPNIIEVGGSHIEPPKKLPDDLQRFLDEATEGVVLFSMGSALRSQDLKPEIRESLLKAFSKIKQKVLWKFEAELDDLPKNVKIMKWVPQQDVLAHPNVKAFISHGGLLSTMETVYHAVPIVGIPVLGDQKSNIAAAVINGYAVSVSLTDLSEEKLSIALDEVLNNPKYKENIQKRSKLIRDQPIKPLDSAVYWVEHVIRHQGAPHLRSAATALKWYQREMVDITLFLALVTGAVFWVLYIIIRKVLKRKPKLAKSKKNQ